MIKVIMLSLILVSTSFAADEFDLKAEECVNKVSTVLGMPLDKGHSNIRLVGTGCSLSIERNGYISGLNQLPIVELRMDGSNGTYLSLDANEDLSTVTVAKCEVKTDSINLKYSGRHKTGWGGSYTQAVKLKLVDGKVVSADLASKSGGWLAGSKSEKFSCKF